MDYLYVNKTLKVPIYKQLSNSITKAIEEGQLKYNDKLPTEKEVCRTFSISHTVVKMAYEELINEHKIKRIKGKGTYVTNRLVFHAQLHEFYQLESKKSKSEIDYTYQTIMFDIIDNDISAYRMLKLQPHEHCFVILRVIIANQNPILLQKAYFPEKYFPKLNMLYEPTDRLFDMIESKFQHQVKHMHNTFSPMNASSDEALLLKIHEDEAIYFVRSNIVNELDQQICYVTNYFPGEFTEFEVMVHAV